jgi:hypothetical protein
MSMRTDLAHEAMAAARRVRIQSGLSAESPICIFDLVEHQWRDQIDLRFKAAPSLEGVYVRGNPTAGHSAIIIVSSLRPSGRQRTTCAHELGHHIFNHGSSIDQIVEEGSSGRFEPNESLANAFAGFLTMPKLGVLKAFADRKLKVASASPLNVYTVASQFGVGFTTLLNHLAHTLAALSREDASRLLKITPKRLREELLGRSVSGELVIVDEHWRGRAVDLSVGGHAALPIGCKVEGETLRFVEKRPIGDIYIAERVGRGRIEDPSSGMAAYVRVSRFQYEGRGMFRHMEESDDE